MSQLFCIPYLILSHSELVGYVFHAVKMYLHFTHKKKTETDRDNAIYPSVYVVDITNIWVFQFLTLVLFPPHLYFYEQVEEWSIHGNTSN